MEKERNQASIAYDDKVVEQANKRQCIGEYNGYGNDRRNNIENEYIFPDQQQREEVYKSTININNSLVVSNPTQQLLTEYTTINALDTEVSIISYIIVTINFNQHFVYPTHLFIFAIIFSRMKRKYNLLH